MKEKLLFASAAVLMLGSCAKDDAELAPAVNSGKTAFIANMPIDNVNKTRIHLENGEYSWDMGDMVGVSTFGKSQNIPFITNSGGETAIFTAVKEDLDYLGKETFYMVYPYNALTKIEGTADAPTVKMTIPAIQRYRQNSFATMTIPAVAVVENYDHDNPSSNEITFTSLAAYMRVLVNGQGTLKQFKVELERNDRTLIRIAGSNDVSLSEENAKLSLEQDNVENSEDIILDFGEGGLALDYNVSAPLMFVIPTDIELYEGDKVKCSAKLEGDVDFKAVGEFVLEKGYTTERNHTFNIQSKTFTIGLEDKTLITSVDEFLRYVYAVNKFTVDDAEVSDLVWDNEGTKEYKTALIINNELDCSTISDQFISDPSDAMYDAYVWYLRENRGNFMFPAGKKFKLEGVDLKNPVTIANMNVKTSGNGIFENNADALLENIIIKDAVVTVDNDKLNDAVAKFLADNNTESFNNVKVEGGEIKAAAGTIFTKAALLGSVKASALKNNAELVGTDPVYDGKAILVAESLEIDADVDLTNYVATAPKFGEIKGKEPGKQITVKDVALDDVKASIMAIIAETNNSKYFSVMFTEGSNTISPITTSLWTGLVGDFKNQIDTAEAFAAAIAKLETEAVNVALVNNIDLLGKKWISVDNNSKAITINGNKFTLKNVNITNYAYNEQTKKNELVDNYLLTDNHIFSVFGSEANVTSLNVEGLTIDIIGGEVDEDAGETLGEVSVGGLALEGAANYVNLTGATIKVADDVNLKKEDDKKTYIGGIMTEKTGASANNTAVVTFTHPEGTVTNPYFAR